MVKIRKFETLIKSKNYKYADRWSPHSVDYYSNAFSLGELNDMSKILKKNLAYSFQYLEYLELQLSELNLHSIVNTHCYKTFVITGVSIIEGIFGFILKKNDLWKKEEWSKATLFEQKQVVNEGSSFRLEKYFSRKLDSPKDKEMSFYEVLDVIEKKRVLGLSHEQYRSINYLRKIRNRIHLQSDEIEDTDWNKITSIDYLFMKKNLLIVLGLSQFNIDISKFDYLNLTSSEEKRLIEYLNKHAEV